MDETKNLLKNLNKPISQPKLTPIATEMFVPNHSGTHDAGILNKTPTRDNDLVNKKYVDDENDKDLHLDQTTPQTIVNGKPVFTEGLNIGSGTFNPNYPLHAIKNINGSYYLILKNESDGASATTGFILGNDTGVGVAFQLGGTGSSIIPNTARFRTDSLIDGGWVFDTGNGDAPIKFQTGGNLVAEIRPSNNGSSFFVNTAIVDYSDMYSLDTNNGVMYDYYGNISADWRNYGTFDVATGFSIGGGALIGYTGDLKDSTSTKIADVVGGIITAVYY